jgi:hypothetical protein
MIPGLSRLARAASPSSRRRFGSSLRRLSRALAIGAIAGALVASFAIEAARADPADSQSADGLLANALAELSSQNVNAYKALEAMKSEVGARAYRRTLALCEGYRMAYSLSGYSYHRRLMIPPSESLAEWARVMGHGLASPFTTMFGIGAKSDFIAEASLSEFGYYALFRSLYSLLLIDSDGFFRAASHCLNTGEAGEIERFALAIAEADAIPAGLSQGALTVGVAVSGAAIAKVIAQPLRWLFRPARALLGALRARANRATGLALAAAAVAGAGALATPRVLAVARDRAAAEDAFARLGTAEDFDTLKPAMRLVRLLGLFELLQNSTAKGAPSEQRAAALSQFEQSLKKLSDGDRAEWAARWRELDAKAGRQKLAGDEAAEFLFLDVIVAEPAFGGRLGPAMTSNR